jgi:hypothetical protein
MGEKNFQIWAADEEEDAHDTWFVVKTPGRPRTSQRFLRRKAIFMVI